MNVNNLLAELYNKLRKGIKPGLERTIKLAEHLNMPHKKYKVIHIAGTNGKGATASFLASILTEAGFKVGLYTSPHIFRFNERIRINGKQINDEELVFHYNRIKEISEKIEATFFEITTVLAFDYFAEKNVDYAIIETGMGGRFDSTNIVDPACSIITSIGMDHKEFLGDTIDKIAFEKAGIIKEEKPVLISQLIDVKAKKVIKQKAKRMNSKLLEIKMPEKINYLKEMSSEIANNYQLNLPGKNQIMNFQIAKEAAFLVGIDDYNIIQNSINNLYLNTGYIGRMTVICKNPKIIIDISHNEEAVQNIIDVFKLHNINNKIEILFTCMQDKDYNKILNKLKLIASKIIITKTQNERNISPQKLIDYCEKNKIDYEYIEKIDDKLLSNYHEKIDTLVTGSFFLLEELKSSLKKINSTLFS